ncbi:hypothetical protein GQ53DRAFT_635257 [Thozetella sp. PMI_491]|nr:hypothetical protein GQ53DRAFT_635257 [Thozetella sp. PMI_491]
MESLQNSFQFGIELEFLLGCRKKTYSNWKSLAKDVSKRLLKAGILNHINEGGEKTKENYTEWSIVQEVTVPSNPGKNLWGIELVSPVYPIYSYWATDINTIFGALESSFTITQSSACSTHVHISAAPDLLSAPELATLGKAVLYYEEALDQLVPTGRRGSTAYWCQSNRANPALKHLEDLSACFDRIDQAAATSLEKDKMLPVIEALNLFPAASAYGKSHGKTRDFVRGKVYKWNFSGMLPGQGLGTVEYRQAPGSITADQAAGWVTLMATFVAGAISLGPYVGHGEADTATSEELWSLLVGGADSLGWGSLGAVEELFTGVN